MKYYVCERLRLCSYLTERGFSIAKVEPDPKNTKYNIFFFEETPELIAAVVRYFSTDCLTAQLNDLKARRAAKHI